MLASEVYCIMAFVVIAISYHAITNYLLILIVFESLDTSIVQSQKKGVMDQVIYGVVMFCSICLLGLIMLFVYKKRHSFKDIIITKTAVAKSNSYKSNVGCKLDIFLCFIRDCQAIHIHVSLKSKKNWGF